MNYPSDFRQHPFDSVLHNYEAEVVACNILIILSRTDNVFRLLSWEEYKLEREKDGEFTKSEEGYFKQVVGFCTTAEAARTFSPVWRDRIMKQLTKEEALSLYESGVWQSWSDEEIVKVQLFQNLLFLPFARFHQAIEKVFHRPVSRHMSLPFVTI